MTPTLAHAADIMPAISLGEQLADADARTLTPALMGSAALADARQLNDEANVAPAVTGPKPCYIEEAELDPGAVLVFRDFGHKVRMAYDPQQISPLRARQLLAMYVEYVEVTPPAPGPLTKEAALAQLRAERVTATGPLAEFLDAFMGEIDRTGDPAGVADQILNGIDRNRVRDLCIEHRVRLLPADGPNASSLTAGILAERDGQRVFVVPPGQRPGETLAQLRTAIAAAKASK